MKYQVKPNHYFNKSYDTKERFISYWHQINEIMTLEPDSILEIGIGNGLVFNYLEQRGFKVITMDIDKRLKPNKIGSVVSIPLPDESFEVVACFEVLEHLPYEDLSKALNEIYRVSSKYAVLSLPDFTRVYRLDIQIPKIGELKKLISLPRLRVPVHEFDGQHYWEIGKAGYPLLMVMNEIRNAGFEIKKTWRIFEASYHRFFILRK